MTATDRTYLDALKGRLISLARDLVLIPSTASRPDDVQRCIDFVRNHLEPLDAVRIEQIDFQASPTIIARPEGIDEPEILLLGHLDVIDHGTTHTYRSILRDGRIYGPGAGDMKGPLAILMELFRSFHTARRDISLGLAITSDEEQGGMSGTRHLFEDAGLRCGQVVLPDGGDIDHIIVQEKGLLHLELECTGRSAHAAMPWIGDNPLDHLCHRLRQLQDDFEKLWQDDDPDRWFPTLAVTNIRASNQSANRIPAVAQAVMDVRFPPPWTAKQVLEDIEELLESRFALRVILADEPSILQPDPLFIEVTEEVVGHAPKLSRAAGGSDGRFICRHNLPVMLSRPQVGNLHSENEWIQIDSMLSYYHIVERYIQRKLELGSARLTLLERAFFNAIGATGNPTFPRGHFERSLSQPYPFLPH